MEALGNGLLVRIPSPYYPGFRKFSQDFQILPNMFRRLPKSVRDGQRTTITARHGLCFECAYEQVVCTSSPDRFMSQPKKLFCREGGTFSKVRGRGGGVGGGPDD